MTSCKGAAMGVLGAIVLYGAAAQGKVSFTVEDKIEPALQAAMGARGTREAITIAVWLRQGYDPNETILAFRHARSDDARAAALAVAEQKIAATQQPLINWLAGRGIPVLYRSKYAPVIFVAAAAPTIRDIAARMEVDKCYLSMDHVRRMEHAEKTVRADVVWARGITGSTMPAWVAVLEDDRAAPGNLYLTHLNQPNADIFNPGDLPEDHATAVHGIIAASRANDRYRGVAYGSDAMLTANADSLQDVDLVEATEWAMAKGGRIVNCSFGWGRDVALHFMDNYFDYLIRNAFMHFIIASGNDGHGVSVGTPAMAYNVITVGSFQSHANNRWNDDTMSDFSNAVPNTDAFGIGRQKPELVAVGEDEDGRMHLLAAAAPWVQLQVGGTSFAAPAVTGTCQLLTDRRTELLTFPATMKAIVMASACHNIEDDPRLSNLDGAGGLVVCEADEVAANQQYHHAILTASSFQPNGYYTHTINLEAGDGAGPEKWARVVLCWYSNPARQQVTGTSTGLTATTLTDNTNPFGAGGSKVDWFLKPNTASPLTYRVTANTASVLTVQAGDNMLAGAAAGNDYIVFQHSTDPLDADLDLRVWDTTAGAEVASSTSFDNNYEIVRFNPTNTGAYEVRVFDSRFDGTLEEIGIAWAQEPCCKPDWGDAPDDMLPCVTRPERGDFPTRKVSVGASLKEFEVEWLSQDNTTTPGATWEMDAWVSPHVAEKDEDAIHNIFLPPGICDPLFDGPCCTPDMDVEDDGVVPDSVYVAGTKGRVTFWVDTATPNIGRYSAARADEKIYVRGWFDWEHDDVTWDGNWMVEWVGGPSMNGVARVGTCIEGCDLWDATAHQKKVIIEFDVPDFLPEGPFWIRFRLSYGEEDTVDYNTPATFSFADFATFFGEATYGEVEDHLSFQALLPPPDWHTTWVSVPTDNVIDFGAGGLPIPAGFFGDGSNPVTEAVPFEGDPTMPELGDSSICLQRKRDPDLPADGSVDTVDVEVVNLSLVSSNPITVTFVGDTTPPEAWMVHVELSPTLTPPNGTITSTRTHPNGGTFDGQFSIVPLLTFTRVSDGMVLQLDTGATPGFTPLTFNLSGDFVDAVDPGLGVLVDPNAGWVSGVQDVGGVQTIVPITATTTDEPPTVVHTVCPPRRPPPRDEHATPVTGAISTFVDFNAGGLVIPPNFFDSGSDPFTQLVELLGEPLDPSRSTASITLQRDRDPDLPVDGAMDTVDTEVVGLNLVSGQPITVTYNGGANPEPWDMRVELSPSVRPPLGSITSLRTHPNGGTFDGQFFIQPLLTFTRQSDGAVRQLDTGGGTGPGPLHFVISGDFVENVDPGLGILVDPDAHWVSGVQEVGGLQTIVPMTAITTDEPPTVAHKVVPAVPSVVTGACCLPPPLACAEGTTETPCIEAGGVFTAGGSCTDPELACPCNDPTQCDDGNACTIDDCVLESAECTHAPAYNVFYECCNPLNGVVTAIYDDDPCTTDVCDPATGSVSHDPAGAAGNPCDDGNDCTIDDVCDGTGICGGTDITGLPCATDSDCPSPGGCDRNNGACVCPTTGACCHPDGTCTIESPQACSQGRIWKGPETQCSPDTCTPPAEIRLVPVDSTGGFRQDNNVIYLNGGDQQVTLEVRLSNWDADLNGIPELAGYQATIDSSTYASGSGAPLTPLTTPDPSAGAFIDQTRTDFVFFGLDFVIAGVTTDQPDYVWFGVVPAMSCKSDDGSGYYGGTLILEVPPTAAGTYMVQWDTQSGSTSLLDCNSATIPSAPLPAFIVISTCGDGTADTAFGEACDGADDLACPGLCQPDCTCPSPVAAPLAAPFPHDRRKNRYISFDPNKEGNDGTSVAFKVELLSINQGSCNDGTGGNVDSCRTDRSSCTGAGNSCTTDADCGPEEACTSGVDCKACSGSGNACISAPIDCPSGESCNPTGAVCVNDAPNSGGANVGMVWWVGPEKDTAANPSPNIHLLVSEPFRKVSTDWPNPVHAGDCEVVPQASYGVRAVETAGGAESDELVVETIQFPPVSPPAPFWWGDVVGVLAFHCNGDIRQDTCSSPADCAGDPCKRAWELPNGVTNVDDVTAALWTSAPAPPTTVSAEFTWVDVHGNDSFTPGSQNFDPPNNKINASDLQQIISGFGGFPYKFYDPADCPDAATWP